MVSKTSIIHYKQLDGRKSAKISELVGNHATVVVRSAVWWSVASTRVITILRQHQPLSCLIYFQKAKKFLFL